jgi:SHAQKYF class myb-like DNA-binding protein
MFLEEELRKANSTIARMQMASESAPTVSPSAKPPRYWTKKEHQKFIEAIEIHGDKNVKAVSTYVGTRSPQQVRTHHQKWAARMKEHSEEPQDERGGAEAADADLLLCIRK